MDTAPKPQRREVQLEPGLQARLLEQMRQERDARLRGRALRRYLLLPAFMGAIVVTLFMTFYGDQTNSMVGNVLASSLIWFVWKIRTRLGSVFGFG